jgi:polysaccharide pyruvyl transferase WcaK-like protein
VAAHAATVPACSFQSATIAGGKQVRALALGIDYSNLGSLAMLQIVKSNFEGQVSQVCHVDPIALGIESIQANEAVPIRLRSYLKWLITPKFLWSFILSDQERGKLALFQAADIIFDISGFALSSNFPVFSTLRYLAPVYLACKLGKSVVLLPQSFGPFAYRWEWPLVSIIRHVLGKTEKIFARDQSSLSHLLRNRIQAIRSFDLVFLYDEKKHLGVKLPGNGRFVGIVPNVHLLKALPEDKLVSVYVDLMSGLHDRGFVPVLFSHTLRRGAGSDLEMLRRIAKACDDRGAPVKNRYVFIDQALTIECINYLCSKFEFIVASRFHCLVFCYKNCKPAILLGWADKYKQLASDFEQERYVVSADQSQLARALISRVDALLQNYGAEVGAITERLAQGRSHCRQSLSQYLPGICVYNNL